MAMMEELEKNQFKEDKNKEQTREQANEQDIEALIAILDGYTAAEGSRLKIDVVEGDGEIVDRKYHHGRCDICSPWATGQAFDVLE